MTLKIRYQRSGGFAGLLRGGEIDTTALAPAASRLVMRLVNTALFAGVKPGAKSKTRGVVDARVHDFEIEIDGETFRWSFDDRFESRVEFSLPKALIPLVAVMAKRSKPMTAPPPRE